MPYFEIPQALIYQVSGADSVRYLQARLTNDIQALDVGSGCLAAALSAQGKTEALFYVGRLAPDRFLLVCDGGEPESVSDALRRFIVADRVDVDDKTAHWTLLHWINADNVWQAPLAGCSAPENDLSFTACEGCTAIRRQRLEQPGYDFVLSEEELPQFLSSLNGQGSSTLSIEEITLSCVKANLPRFPQEINQRRLLLEIECSEIVSNTKGCYVGQEVIEKVRSIGKAPRRIIPIAVLTEDALVPGEKIYVRKDDSLTEVGSILTSAFDQAEKQAYAFANVRSDALESSLELNESIPLQQL